MVVEGWPAMEAVASLSQEFLWYPDRLHSWSTCMHLWYLDRLAWPTVFMADCVHGSCSACIHVQGLCIHVQARASQRKGSGAVTAKSRREGDACTPTPTWCHQIDFYQYHSVVCGCTALDMIVPWPSGRLIG